MRSKYLFLLSYVLVITVVIPAFSLGDPSTTDFAPQNELKSSALTEMNATITINDLPGSLTNWTWAKSQGYCTGEGTASNPYIISDYFFNTSTIVDNCLNILNSRKYFIIENCLFEGHWDQAGVKLTNSTFGLIRENELYPATGALVWIYNSSLNTVNNNNASASTYTGLLVDGTGGQSSLNLMFSNLISFNPRGIQFRGVAIYNQILRNTIDNNSVGIEVNILSDNNIIQLNMISDNAVYGIGVDSDNNTVYKNCFINNFAHAIDEGVNNNWDYLLSGNYWDNYNGSDNNGDGIGDVPYNITGPAGSEDNYPLMNCPLFETSEQGIPGYNLIILLTIGAGMVISLLYLSLRKKIGLNL